MGFKRLAAIAGLVFLVLLVANAILLGDQPSPDASVRDIHGYLAADEGLHDAAAVTGLLLYLPAVVFFAGLFHRFRPSDREHNESWAVALVISGVLLASTAAIGDAAFGTLSLRAGDTVSPGVLRALWDLQYVAYSATGIAIAALTVSVAVPVLRHHLLPVWHGILSCVVALIGIVGIFAVVSPDLDVLGLIPLPALAIWILITSVIMLREREPASRPTTQPT